LESEKGGAPALEKKRREASVCALKVTEGDRKLRKRVGETTVL